MTLPTPIPLKEACKYLGGISRSTFMRYVQGKPNGKKLNAYKIGGDWYTDAESIEQFKDRPGNHRHEPTIRFATERRRKFGF